MSCSYLVSEPFLDTYVSIYITYYNVNTLLTILVSYNTLLLVPYVYVLSSSLCTVIYSSYCYPSLTYHPVKFQVLCFNEWQKWFSVMALWKKYTTISLVGHYKKINCLSLTLSVTKTYFILVCLEFLPTDFMPLVSCRIVILLSW